MNIKQLKIMRRKKSWRKKIAILGRQSVLITGAAKSRYGESNIVVF
jgi:hypothetical protein